ncbi:FAD dependent oxidoreductase [Microbulbifer aggregans]|uniref:FAD dependent oxidoreductase n=1 Tax=Microbulbifer aggregans TaxID=1769779 RepID=A0A1C9W5V1_9GAMM|nr:FAD-dependent oxidoreductase [Microbulbifer aggregans]AOS96510.1 FAD dependent oxidoreductase [Microbulbifer aggregans]
MNSVNVEAAVIGASLGGVLAAYQLCKRGVRTLLASEFDWIGGQLTSQGVPPDEHSYIESFGASDSYYRFRQAIREYYLANEQFHDNGTMTEGCNPGDGWVSRLCFEPAVAERYLRDLLQPHIASGLLRLQEHCRPIDTGRSGRNIAWVELEHQSGERLRVHAHYFLDATDTGELLAQADLPYRLGKESRAAFNERQAPEQASMADQQPVTFVFALQKTDPAQSTAIPKPEAYDFWKNYIVPHYGYPLFSDHLPGHEGYSSVQLPLFGDGETLDLWRYRRVVAAHNWDDGRADISLINWAQNDYALAPLLDGPTTQAQVVAEARELSFCLAHWLQTEAPRSWIGEEGQGFPELSLATTALGTEDGLAQQVYVRESRRIVGLQTLTQSELELDPAKKWDPACCDHSVGIGLYNMDIHPTCESGMGSNARVRPFELPLEIFIPADADNLLPACKNLSVTHLVNAATRVHPIEWLVGEVAGLLAAFCIRQELKPGTLAAREHAVVDFQRSLTESGIPLHWPDNPAITAVD